MLDWWDRLVALCHYSVPPTASLVMEDVRVEFVALDKASGIDAALCAAARDVYEHLQDSMKYLCMVYEASCQSLLTAMEQTGKEPSETSLLWVVVHSRVKVWLRSSYLCSMILKYAKYVQFCGVSFCFDKPEHAWELELLCRIFQEWFELLACEVK